MQTLGKAIGCGNIVGRKNCVRILYEIDIHTKHKHEHVFFKTYWDFHAIFETGDKCEMRKCYRFCNISSGRMKATKEVEKQGESLSKTENH